MLEVTAPTAVAAERPPFDEVLVLDRSGSMSGDPLHAVKEATCNLLRLFGADDRLGVVVFDHEVQMVLPLAHHDSHAASGLVRRVQSGDSTNPSGGWLKGLEMLCAGGRPGALKRIVLLTDGQANAGVTDHDELCRLSRAAADQQVTTTTIGFSDSYEEVLLARDGGRRHGEHLLVRRFRSGAASVHGGVRGARVRRRAEHLGGAGSATEIQSPC